MQIVTATLGSARLPILRTAITNRSFAASDCLAANDAVAPLLTGVDADLLRPPVNVMRLALHPAGLAPRIANLPEWRDHLLFRLRRQYAETLALHERVFGPPHQELWPATHLRFGIPRYHVTDRSRWLIVPKPAAWSRRLFRR